MEKILISVIVPVYKVEEYLPKCLDSILVQTHSELEIILVDDGSPDKCGAICDEYAARDSRITVIHQQNAGVSAARNAGLDIASGEYIGFVDSDDWIEPEMYEFLLELLCRSRCDISQCGRTLRPENKLSCTPESDILINKNSPEKDYTQLSCEVTNKLFRRHLLKDLRFDRDVAVGEDMLFMLRAINSSSCFVLGHRPLYNYFIRPGSASRPLPTADAIRSSISFIPKVCSFLPEAGATRNHYLSRMIESLLDTFSRLCRNFEPEYTPICVGIRDFMRSHLPIIRTCCTLSAKDKLKCRLLARTWRVYRLLLITSKKISGAK